MLGMNGGLALFMSLTMVSVLDATTVTHDDDRMSIAGRNHHRTWFGR
jgi:hypothetical protein